MARGTSHSTVTDHTYVVDSQSNSRLLQLPQELRDHIYDYIFSSTRFCFGERAVGRIDIDTRKVVAANCGKSLALLRVCRQTHAEIGTRWLSQCLFHFEDPSAMLDKLALIDDRMRSQIRYVRVSGDPLKVTFGYDEVHWRTPQFLKLLPSLNLTRLSILGHKYARTSYETLDALIKYSDGWKELHYLSHNSEMLGFRAVFDAQGTPRLPQPGAWQQAIDARDGSHAKASVKIFRSNSPTRGWITNPGKRSAFYQQYGIGQTAETYGRAKDPSLMVPGEREKELLVIVKRGDGVNYAETNPTSFLLHNDIREDSPASNWASVKELARDTRITSDSEDEDEVDDTLLRDEYDDVDEYTWPPFHLFR